MIPAVIPVLLAGVGAGALACGWLVLRSFGPRFRVGRLLATTPHVSIAEAIDLAGRDRAPYVRIEGGVDSETDFEDADHRPLVYRRTRVQVAGRGRWRTVEDGREAVPFGLREELTGLAIDGDALGDGLVVVVREAAGVASDVPDRVPDGTPPATPVRIRIEQVSSVEHAIALGVPGRAPAGTLRLTAGAGRPLVLTTLAQDEAMRVLAEGRRVRAITAAALLVGGLALLAAGAVAALVSWVG